MSDPLNGEDGDGNCIDRREKELQRDDWVRWMTRWLTNGLLEEGFRFKLQDGDHSQTALPAVKWKSLEEWTSPVKEDGDAHEEIAHVNASMCNPAGFIEVHHSPSVRFIAPADLLPRPYKLPLPRPKVTA